MIDFPKTIKAQGWKHYVTCTPQWLIIGIIIFLFSKSYYACYISLGFIFFEGTIFLIFMRMSFIDININAFTYSTFGSTSKLIIWKNIKAIQLSTYGYRILLHSYLIVQYDGTLNTVCIDHLSKEDLKFFTQSIISRTSQGTLIDPELEKIANGVFPWYIF